MVGPDRRILAGTAGGALLRIASASPAPGTPVGQQDQVTVQLESVDLTPPPAYRPCEWVTPEKAAAHLGVTPIATTADGDHQGSTDVICDYSFNDTPEGSPNRHSVSSQLRLTTAHVVDAA